jgi:hypothetical protein
VIEMPLQPVTVRLKSALVLQGTIAGSPDAPFFYLETPDGRTYMIPWGAVEWIEVDV